MNKNLAVRICAAVLVVCTPVCVMAVPSERGVFDMERWDSVIDNVRTRAAAQNISRTTIDATLKSPAFIPSIVRSDKNQSEFTLTLEQYLNRTVNPTRIAGGKKMRATYPTMLSRVDAKYGVPPHVILAFWGMESNYGAVKARHNLRDAFLTLMYEGRRETFFGNQLLALMQIADKNNLDITEINGSWAGAMGHFQFIPTTLAAYGVDGNGDGKVDIIHSIGDAMFSAGNYLNKLGWNENERIVRRVTLPADFDLSLLDGKTKMSLAQWAALGVTNPDGTPIPQPDMTAGLVADVTAAENARAATASAAAAAQAAAMAQMNDSAPRYGEPNVVYIMDTDIPPMPTITAYLTYPNFYRIKKWNNSNWYAIAIAELADELK